MCRTTRHAPSLFFYGRWRRRRLQRGAWVKAGEIHGIPPEEIAQGPDFANAFAAFVSFVNGLLNAALETDTDSEDEEEPDRMRIAEVLPRIVLAAHNGSVGHI